MRTQATFVLLAILAALLGACGGQSAPPTPAGQAVGKPTLLYMFADP